MLRYKFRGYKNGYLKQIKKSFKSESEASAFAALRFDALKVCIEILWVIILKKSLAS